MRVVVVANDDGTDRAAAVALQGQLATDPRLTVRDVEIASRHRAAETLDLPALQAVLREAQEAYVRLEPQVALTRLDDVEAALRRFTDVKEARQALAHALRLRGLAFLFLEKNQSAGESFGAAWALDPDFSPAAEEWPPEARLAYADAVAVVKRGGTGSLTVTTLPRTAQIFVDVKFVSTTNTDLLNLGVDYGDAGPQVSLSGGAIPITFPFDLGKGGFEDGMIANTTGTGPFADPTLNAGSTQIPDTIFGSDRHAAPLAA